MAAAGLHTIAAPPWEWWWCAWVVPGLLLVPTRRQGALGAVACGLAFGVLLGFGIAGWAIPAALDYFDADLLRATLFMVVVWVLTVGVPYAALLSANRVLAPRLAPAARPLGAAWLWVLMELLRAHLFSGMPWELLGHTQFRRLALIQVADLGGAYAVSFVIVLASVALGEIVADAWRTRRVPVALVPRLAVPAVVLAATMAYGGVARSGAAAPAADEPVRRLAVVQGNVPNAFRWRREFFEDVIGAYGDITRLVRGMAPDLVVWPENAANFYLEREPRLRALLATAAAGAHDGLVVGGPRLAAAGEARNAVYLVGARGEIDGVYDKQRLVPLAEYNPFPAISTRPAGEPAYGPGDRGVPLATRSMQVGAVICYEVLFPHLVRELVRRGAQVLVNVSNDTWLDHGDGAAPRQHFSMAVFRAVETRRYLVRAAASGVSGFITPAGETYATLPASVAGAAVASVHLRRGETAYVRHGDRWVAVVGVLVALLARARVPEATA